MAPEEEKKSSSREDLGSENTHSETAHSENAHGPEKKRRSPYDDLEGVAPDRLNAIFENPLAGIPKEDLLRDVTEFCTKFDLTDHLDDFKKGALVSQNPFKLSEIPELSEDDRHNLMREVTNKWSQPWSLYWLASM